MKKVLIRDYLQDMLDAMDKAVEFVGDHDQSSFKADEKCTYAVIRCLEIVGEAAKKIPSVVRREQTEIPWKNLDGMRDKLVHDYAGVDLEVVYNTVKDDIPSVQGLLINLIEELDE